MRRLTIIGSLLCALLLVTDGHTALTLELKPLANGLTNITSITAPHDGTGRLFITQQNGQVRIFDGTKVLGTNFLDISSLVNFPAGSEQGLLNVAFHPGYGTNGLFYITYSALPNGDLTIARYSVSTNPNIASISGSQILLSIGHGTNTNHNGGQMQFGPDGYLYISTGDGGGACDAPNNSQNLGLPLGKMLRIDVNTNTSYRIPPSNPFVSSNGVLPIIWAYGLRNPWRFSFDRLTGDMFIGDVGQSTREEIDFQAAGSPGGQNYGWRLYEGFCTNCCSVAFSNVPTMLPIFDYGHVGGACAIMGGYRYRGAQIAPLAGTYIYGDYCSGQFWGLTTNGSGGWTSTQLFQTNIALTTFGQDEVGELYAANYSISGGSIYKIVAHDSVGDGIADWWRQQYFGGSGTTTNSSSCAACDPDGDKSSNLQEYLAGTNPLDARSFLHITSATPSNNNFVVTFASMADRKYNVERTTNLVTGLWSTVVSNLIGTGNSISITDVAAPQPNTFYRVRLVP